MTTIISRIRRGVGQGEGANYVPGLNRRSVPSHGRSTHLPLFGRTRHHVTLSANERRVAVLLAWDDEVLDIQEQYPLLPVSLTQELAASRGIRHPMENGFPVERTLDFKVMHARLGWVGLSFKPEDDVNGSKSPVGPAGHLRSPVSLRQAKRKRDLLEIERAFSAQMGWLWGMVSEDQVPLVRARNLDILRERWNIQLAGIGPEHHEEIAARVAGYLKAGAALAEACNRTETALRLPGEGGSAIAVSLNRLARKAWSIDLDHPLDLRTLRPRTKPPQAEDGWITGLRLLGPRP